MGNSFLWPEARRETEAGRECRARGRAQRSRTAVLHPPSPPSQGAHGRQRLKQALKHLGTLLTPSAPRWRPPEGPAGLHGHGRGTTACRLLREEMEAAPALHPARRPSPASKSHTYRGIYINQSQAVVKAPKPFGKGM